MAKLNLKSEVKLVKSNEKLTTLVKETKTYAKGIFAMHRNVVDLYTKINSECFEGHEVLMDGKLNPTIKTIKDKSFKPFGLFYGTLTLDKVLKASKTGDFLSFMELYNKAVLTFIAADVNEQSRILERGQQINKLVCSFNQDLISAPEFIESLFDYFPSFYSGLKDGKIKPNVAKFIYENDRELYENWGIAKMYDVQLQIIRKEVKKAKGNEGLIKFDALIKDGHKVKNIVAQFEGVENATTLELAK